MSLKDLTAAELADALAGTEHFPHSTGQLSMLDEATLAFTSKSTEIRKAQEAFAAARLAHRDSYHRAGHYTDEAWQRAVDAAQQLAALLRPLGGFRIAWCTEQVAGWGVCDSPLDESGLCSGAHMHSPPA